ncbi:MAG TPA: hypothetical protein VIY73_09490 [Polyangiaceae bacterium]
MKYSFAIAAAIALVAACGGSGSGKSGDSPTTDAGTSDVASQGTGNDTGAPPAPEAGTDAAEEEAGEPADEGPWPADHYAIPLMTNSGGTVLAAPQIVSVNFVGNVDRDALRTFDDQFAEGTPWWSAVTNGYSIGAATGGQHYELPDTVSNTTLDDDNLDIFNLIVGWVASGAVPEPTENTIFVIFFPVSTTITFEGSASCQAFAGYHSQVVVPTEGGYVTATYAVIPNCPQTGTDQPMADTTFATSHEVIEAATDPHGASPAWGGYNLAWFRQGKTPVILEVADACENYAPVTDTFGNTLTRSWVNAAAKLSSDPCQPELPGEVFYDLAVPTTTETPSTPGYPKSDGYIVVPAGSTQTIDATFFSEAKLPNDAQISVGARSHGQTSLNPTIATGVTASVTPTAAHNGMHVTLTITAASTAVSGDYNASALSTLKTGDSHSWPFIVRITGGAAASDGGAPKPDGG